MKNKNLLVTGGYGFLGRNVARYFSDLGYTVYGVGHGNWTSEEYREYGFSIWKGDDITVESITSLNVCFDVIIHCGGSGSVAYSITNPYQDFGKTVSGTAAVLEYIRLYNPDAKLIYPSSPAVHGEHCDSPIKEDDGIRPASPYGEFKYMAEHLCHTYSNNFSVNIVILRLFSVYGEGLTKQLLWDASNKIVGAQQAVFWGCGYETRDWIHVDDAIRLMHKVADSELASGAVVNAGSGKSTTIKAVLDLLARELDYSGEIEFNQIVRAGDPLYYWADITKALDIGWSPKVELEDGIKRYAKWFLNQIKQQ
ncbi:NAD-dependent epimerase/dehydratase family protein [Rheinheimera tangshanensis]|uniref:NAD(P)-dependent oxidoreductase n=1 Tax=Rheinheimera tangshanensis TaxID=400153 RepID=A0A5C8LWC6_9GAMM|nr:NAD(P)-dependent oxidoreductase [Rheinheimera tangshanensis]TXK80495.1 NAD(P)-dependent oxidoreductase [Rheinheimera tangshanensis]GGM60856.1 UDP-glucose 4-epimerase [Rheinheimera tangshanensis]